MNLGILLEAKGHLVGAEAEFRTVLALDPKHAAAHTCLAIILDNKGDAVGPRPSTRATDTIATDTTHSEPSSAPAQPTVHAGAARELSAPARATDTIHDTTGADRESTGSAPAQTTASASARATRLGTARPRRARDGIRSGAWT